MHEVLFGAPVKSLKAHKVGGGFLFDLPIIIWYDSLYKELLPLGADFLFKSLYLFIF